MQLGATIVKHFRYGEPKAQMVWIIGAFVSAAPEPGASLERSADGLKSEREAEGEDAEYSV